MSSTTMLQSPHLDSTAQLMSTKHTDSQEQSPLYKLPPELRNRIYLYTTSHSEAKSPLATVQHFCEVYEVLGGT